MTSLGPLARDPLSPSSSVCAYLFRSPCVAKPVILRLHKGRLHRVSNALRIALHFRNVSSRAQLTVRINFKHHVPHTFWPGKAGSDPFSLFLPSWSCNSPTFRSSPSLFLVPAIVPLFTSSSQSRTQRAHTPILQGCAILFVQLPQP